AVTEHVSRNTSVVRIGQCRTAHDLSVRIAYGVRGQCPANLIAIVRVDLVITDSAVLSVGRPVPAVSELAVQRENVSLQARFGLRLDEAQLRIQTSHPETLDVVVDHNLADR